ncbi:MAG: hypothetical protein KGL39_60020 [Patescibacteria group bacterium]|nr:hypothetical protein [Patescibacteria group bacterium]
MKHTKVEHDGSHEAHHYLVVGDEHNPATWHLPVMGPDGKPDHRHMGAAWAALHEGYRGHTYDGPDKEGALARLKAMYKSEGMLLPRTQHAGRLLFPC